MDAVLLARIQFAANMTFHILFPSITIALGWILLFFKLRFNATQDPKWLDAYKLWVKIFALCFGIGVVSGVTMSFQFGTNWPGFMEKVGNIAGPFLAYEILTAFFMEASFLSVMLFGFGKVPDKVHTLATFLVALGTTISAFWITALNSWMHTPAGFTMIDGKAHVTSWIVAIFNPSMPYRLVHMLLASGLTASFLVAGISAYSLLRGHKSAGVMAAMKTGIYAAAILIPLQIVAGDQHGLNTLEYEPAKIAAIEGIWQTGRGLPMELFAIPDEKEHADLDAIEIPKVASLILTHHLDGEVKGLNEFVGEAPPVLPIFFAFRIMVGTGMLMLLTAWTGAWQIRGGREPKQWYAVMLVAMTFAGWVATVAGWYVTEIGRQPWIVHGIIKTADTAAKNVSAHMIYSTLSVYLVLYAFLLASFISVVFYIARKSEAAHVQA